MEPASRRPLKQGDTLPSNRREGGSFMWAVYPRVLSAPDHNSGESRAACLMERDLVKRFWCCAVITAEVLAVVLLPAGARG